MHRLYPIAVLFLTALPVIAQMDRAVLTGVVLDPSKSAIILPLPVAFIRDKDEGLVPDDRAAQRGPELVQPERRMRRQIERRPRVKDLLRTYSKAEPWNSLDPDFVTTSTCALGITFTRNAQ